MNASDLISIGIAMMGGIGYGVAALFLLAALAALISAMFRSRAQDKFNRRMDTFAIAVTAAFVLALLTTICLKIVG